MSTNNFWQTRLISTKAPAAAILIRIYVGAIFLQTERALVSATVSRSTGAA
ncbi:hypothetical protein [Nocardia sp. NPDC057440]|uniref:hypothetical protein n=1 Tax=Nocardia sp. NPDC057440 TaxID=3346134 RepID=UPI00366C9375